MGRAVVDADRLRDVILADRNNARGAFGDDLERLGLRVATSHAVGKGERGIGLYRAARLERQRERRRALGDNADNLGFKVEQIPHCDQTADPRAHSNGNVDHIEFAARK